MTETAAPQEQPTTEEQPVNLRSSRKEQAAKKAPAKKAPAANSAPKERHWTKLTRAERTAYREALVKMVWEAHPKIRRAAKLPEELADKRVLAGARTLAVGPVHVAITDDMDTVLKYVSPSL